MALRHLALALGTFAFLFVVACGGTSPGTLDTDSPAMPWEAPDEADLVDADEEPDPEFPVPDLPLDDDDDDGTTTEDPTAASATPGDGAAADPTPKTP
jgi:hypothetical protein